MTRDEAIAAQRARIPAGAMLRFTQDLERARHALLKDLEFIDHAEIRVDPDPPYRYRGATWGWHRPTAIERGAP